MSKHKTKKQRAKPAPRPKVFSKKGLGHATHVEADLWNVWFHWNVVQGQSKCVAENVSLGTAQIVLAEIDKTGEHVGNVKSK
jgi:hypothetical protein